MLNNQLFCQYLSNSIFIMEEAFIQSNPQVSALPSGRTDLGAMSHLYEEVIGKNFQIFKNILPRINSLFQMNDQLQQCVSAIEKKLSKMESDNENLHYEMRTNYLAIDTKLNSIIAEYTHITCEASRIKNQSDQLKRQFNEQKGKCSTEKIVSRVQKKYEIKSKISEKTFKEKKISFVDEINQKQVQNEIISSRHFVNRQKRSSINLSSQSSIRENKVKFNLSSKEIINSERSIPEKDQKLQKLQAQKSQKQNRKANLKPSRTIGAFKEVQQGNIFTQKLIKKESNGQSDDILKFQNFLKQMENYHIHNQKMKENYQELMAEYCRIQQSQFTEIQNQIKLIETRISQANVSANPVQHITPNFENQVRELKQYIDSKIEEKIIHQHQLEDNISAMNGRLKQVNEEGKKMANRDQTKKALEFLEGKINTLMEDYYDNSKLQKTLKTVQIDKFGCFRSMKLSTQNPIDTPTKFIPTQEVSSMSTHIETRSLSKRQAQSLHIKRLNGAVIQNRFNEQLTDWQCRNTEAKEKPEQGSYRMKNRDYSALLLKKKSMDILGRQKIKPKPKLKKQCLIFQYD